MRGSRTLGIAVVIVAVSLLCVFIIEEMHVTTSNSQFKSYEISDTAIDINTATADELKELEGVGDSLATNIVKFRETRPFETAEDIMLVEGVGKNIFEKNRTRIKVK